MLLDEFVQMYESYFGKWPFSEDNTYANGKLSDALKPKTPSVVESIVKGMAGSERKAKPLLSELLTRLGSGNYVSGNAHILAERKRMAEKEAEWDKIVKNNKSYWFEKPSTGEICPTCGRRRWFKNNFIPGYSTIFWHCSNCGVRETLDANTLEPCEEQPLFGKDVLSEVEPFHYEEPEQASVPDDEIPF